MKNPTKNDAYLLQSVDNALSILDLLCDEDGLGLSEIASRLGLGRSTAFRLLYTLATHDFVIKDESSKYHLSYRFISIGEIVINQNGLVDAVHPYLEEVSAATRETSHLVIWFTDTRIMFIDKVLGDAVFHMESMVGVTRTAHLTATGKALLAWSSPAVIDRYMEEVKFEEFTPNSIMSVRELRQELARIREQGYSCDNEESELGLTCYAMPIITNGVPLAAISVSGPTQRMQENKDNIVRVLKSTTDRLSS